MTDESDHWEQDFPLQDEFEDFAGRTRRFLVDCYHTGAGYTVMAREVDPEDEGYEFRAFSETSPYGALGQLREKARSAMSVRHLANDRSMLHDRLDGRITVDDELRPMLVIDGLRFDLGEFQRLLSGLEGWEFELKIRSSLE